MEIPIDLYGYKLFEWMHHVSVKNEQENAEKSVLCHLCNRNVLLLESLDFSDDELSIIREQDWINSGNKEIAARANDVMRRKERDKRATSLRASDLYVQLYDETDDYHCLLRSIQVRNIKSICDAAYFDTISEHLAKLPPYWITECVKALGKSYNERLGTLGGFLEDKYKNLYATHDYRHARDIVEALLIVQTISNNEADYRRAILFGV